MCTVFFVSCICDTLSTYQASINNKTWADARQRDGTASGLRKRVAVVVIHDIASRVSVSREAARQSSCSRKINACQHRPDCSYIARFCCGAWNNILMLKWLLHVWLALCSFLLLLLWSVLWSHKVDTMNYCILTHPCTCKCTCTRPWNVFYDILNHNLIIFLDHGPETPDATGEGEVAVEAQQQSWLQRKK